MSTQGQKPSNREIVRGESDESFIHRRARAFADRSREPGDATTWAVVLGALICTLLMVCLSVGDRPGLAIVAFFVTVAWIVYVSHFGHVNVFSVLWGAATTDHGRQPDHLAVFRATTILAIGAAIAVVLDAVTGWSFGWYGLVLAATILAYIIMLIRFPSR